MRNDAYETLRLRWPSVAALRERARRRGPRFAFEFADGGAGSDGGIARNHAALDAVRLLPGIGAGPDLATTAVELFGTRYAAPIGIAPMGGPSVVLPGADLVLARAAQHARIPYTLGLVGGATIEQVAAAAPDVFWFQLYRCGGDDHALAFDLMARAQSAGAKVLVLTLDVPTRTARPRELSAGLQRSKRFRPTARMLCEIAMTPSWGWALLRHGQPSFANLQRYVGAGAGFADVFHYAQRMTGGPFSWDEIARYRDRWQGPMVAKGVLVPEDAERLVALGFDGIVVSNCGGRQSELLPASIDCLPAVSQAVGKRATVLMDSGIRSGADVVRALACGAEAAFAGKAFLWGLGALGPRGAAHVIDLLRDETQANLTQVGARSPLEAREMLRVR